MSKEQKEKNDIQHVDPGFLTKNCSREQFIWLFFIEKHPLRSNLRQQWYCVSKIFLIMLAFCCTIISWYKNIFCVNCCTQLFAFLETLIFPRNPEILIDYIKICLTCLQCTPFQKYNLTPPLLPKASLQNFHKQFLGIHIFRELPVSGVLITF